MVDKGKAKKGYVKTQTVVMAVFLAFAAGFFSGIVLTIFKSGGTRPQAVDAKTAAAMDEARQRKEQIVQLETLTEQNPQDAEAWTRLGHAYFDDDHPEKAIAAYRKSLAIRPGNADVWTDLGVMYRRNRQPDEAIQAFERAVQINPEHEIAWFNKGVVLIHDLEKMNAGLQAWRAVLDINPMARAPNGQTVEELVRHFEE
ncbi:MAG: tetratricopeptide repeat protein [Desulfobacterales bacterium]|nr:tetratricopeptide repeat protein [Desulfobacterales bacterium]